MAARFLGEFMGTLVLVLLGDGVVANVLLEHSKAEGSGWMVITSGRAFAVMAGVFVGCSLHCGPDHGRICWGYSGVVAFPATLENNGRCPFKVGMLLFHTGDPKLCCKSAE